MSKLRNPAVTTLLVTGLLCAGCFKSKNVVRKIPLTNGELTELNGVTYFLPRTVVQVRVPFKKKNKSPGEFSRYAPCFFSEEVAAGRVTTKSTSFSIGQPTFSSRGEQDPEERYIAKIKGGFFENKTMLLEFNPDGVITKGEASSTNTAIDVAIKAARTAVSIAAAAAGGRAPASDITRRSAGEKAFADRLDAEICRAMVVAEAAIIAAESADALAEASGNSTARAEADEALRHAAHARQGVAAEKQRLSVRLERSLSNVRLIESRVSSAEASASNPSDPATASRDLERTHAEAEARLASLFSGLKALADELLNQVICDAKAIKNSVEAAARAVAPSPGTRPEVDAARDDAGEIDKAISFVGKKATGAPYNYPDHTGCFRNEDDTVQERVFLGGFAEAREKHERLVELQGQREKLVAGQSGFDNLPPDTLKLMLEESDLTIKKCQNTFFLGTEDEDNWTGDFEFTPGRSLVSTSYNTWQSSPVLLLFSKSKGLCEMPESNQQGVKIKPTFKAERCAPAPADSRALWVSVSRLTGDDAYFGHLAAANARDERRGERGFYYRVPARAVIKLESGSLTPAQAINLDEQSRRGREWRPSEQPPPTQTLFMPNSSVVAQDKMRVAQLGVTASLPASAAGRTTQYTIEFDEATGAIKVFNLGSNALLEASVVTEAGGAAGDIVAAKQARDKAKAEAADPLNQKKREFDLLKTQNEINAEKKKLAESQQESQP